MKLTIYTDPSFREVREVREVPRIRVPYRVGQHVVKMIQNLDLKDDQQILRTALGSEEQITAVVCATFGLADEDLDCVDAMELADTAKEIIAYVVNKMAELGVSFGDNRPNAETPATTA
jgi:hypothetical protein